MGDLTHLTEKSVAIWLYFLCLEPQRIVQLFLVAFSQMLLREIALKYLHIVDRVAVVQRGGIRQKHMLKCACIVEVSLLVTCEPTVHR